MRAAELGVNGDGRRGREVVDLGTTPVVCAQVLCLPICARNSGSPKRSGCCRSGGGSKNQGTDRTDTRDALRWLKYLRAGCESESKSVGFASPIEPIEPIEPKSNGATTDTRGGRG